MNEQMDCLRFGAHLNEWIDGELSEAEARAMAAHEAECPDCAQAARMARETLELLHTLEDDVPVPLPVQAAWRSAVRAEAAKRKHRRFSTTLRAIGSVAACFVVLAGCTAAFRSSGMLTPADAVHTSMMATAVSHSDAASSLRVMDALPQGNADRSRIAPAIYIASDGSMDEPATASRMRAIPDAEAPAAPVEESLAGAAQNPLLIRSAQRTLTTENFDSDAQSIRDLTTQYGGYLGSDAVSTDADGLRVSEMTSVIPAVEADSFLQTIDLVGNVTFSAEILEDASSAVRDVQAHLDVLQAEQARLNELIPNASDSDELARLSTLMHATLSEIDALTCEANSLNSELDNVRVSIRLEETRPAATLSPTAAPELTQRMNSAFSQSAQNLQSFVHDMAVTLMILLPFLAAILVIALVVIAIVWLVRRRH